VLPSNFSNCICLIRAKSSALVAAIVVPGFLYSHAHGLKAVATPTSTAGGANAFEIIHRDHAAFAIYQTSRTGTSTAENPHVAENKLAYR
jgi:hypothetical protein